MAVVILPSHCVAGHMTPTSRLVPDLCTQVTMAVGGATCYGGHDLNSVRKINKVKVENLLIKDVIHNVVFKK